MAGDQISRDPASPVPLRAVCEMLGLAPADAHLTGVTLRSQSVQPGDLYAALPGAKTHGAAFAAQAVAAGAVAVLTDPHGLDLAGELPVPVLVCPDPRSVLGEVSALVYGYPSRSLTTLGVTGTNGKTTVTYMLAAALQSLGVDTGMIGTTGTWLGGQRLPTERTTPEAPDVQAIMARMVAAGMRALTMEVSSHALVLGRVDAVTFDVAGFTNLSPDHLDFHADMEDYFAAKSRLFTGAHARRAVINTDDEWGRRLARTCPVPKVTYALTGDADWTADDVQYSSDGSRFTAVRGALRFPVVVHAPGDFNVANALAALAMLAEAGYDASEAAGALADFHGVPGRMEVVRSTAPDAPTVIVDYAHTPDAVDRALVSVAPLTQGKIWCVLGCGGDRDREKRPVMGRIAAQRAEHVIVTDDNPRTEDPALIRAAVLSGATEVAVGTEVVEVADRAEAIRGAVMAAGGGDTVLILGKGHETGQEIGGTVYPFDDRVVARDALEGRE